MNTYMFVYSHIYSYQSLKDLKVTWKTPGAFKRFCWMLWEKTPTFGRNGDISQHWGATASGRIWCFLSHTPNSCRIRCGYLQIQTLVFQCVPLERCPKHHWKNWWQGRGHVKWCDSGGSAPFWELDEIGHWEEAKIVPFKNVTWEKQNKLHHHKQHPIVLVQGSMPNVKCI